MSVIQKSVSSGLQVEAVGHVLRGLDREAAVDVDGALGPAGGAGGVDDQRHDRQAQGRVHVHGGFPVKTAQDMAHGFDVGADDTIFWYTDIGWMMGPWLIFGTLILGATMVLYEGTPDYPAADRLWRMVADHGVTVLGVSPTLVRGLMSARRRAARAHDLSQPAHPRRHGRAVEPRAVPLVLQDVGGGRFRSSTTRAEPRSRAASSAAT